MGKTAISVWTCPCQMMMLIDSLLRYSSDQDEIKDKVKGDNGLDFTLIKYTDPVSQERLEGFVYSDFVTTTRPKGSSSK